MIYSYKLSVNVHRFIYTSIYINTNKHLDIFWTKKNIFSGEIEKW